MNEIKQVLVDQKARLERKFEKEVYNGALRLHPHGWGLPPL